MAKFLFWNIANKDLSNLISIAAHQENADVILLVESGIDPRHLLQELNTNFSIPYLYSENIVCNKVQMFTRYSSSRITIIKETTRTVAKVLDIPILGKILLIATHALDKRNHDDRSQSMNMTILRSFIEESEILSNCDKTIFVGDFNMNPFEDGIISAAGLHAVLAKSVAKDVSRVVDGNEYKMFYNPMWKLMGNEGEVAPGTYYYNSAKHYSFFWHTFDQVIIRPKLIENFVDDELRIITQIGVFNLLTSSKRPNKATASDHLPIVFSIKELV